MYRIEGDGDDNGGACCAADAISFAFPLAAAPASHFLATGASHPACPGSAGSPQASPGHVCVYENSSTKIMSAGIVNTTRFGVDLFADSNAAGDYISAGTWAVTAP